MGYIETWGRGVQKIWDACKELGAEMLRYELPGTGLRIYFKALKSAIIDEPKVPKEHFGTLDGTLEEKVVQISFRDQAYAIYRDLNAKTEKLHQSGADIDFSLLFGCPQIFRSKRR